MKHSIPVSVSFMAICLLEFTVRQSLGSVILFAVSAIIFGFLSFLERERDERIDAIRAEITQIRNEVSSVSLRLGWGG